MRDGTRQIVPTEELVPGDLVILAHDHFASTAYAVEEGHTAYDNLPKATPIIPPTNSGEGLTTVRAIRRGRTLPLTPVLRGLFGTAPLGLCEWALLLLLAGNVLWMMELKNG